MNANRLPARLPSSTPNGIKFYLTGGTFQRSATCAICAVEGVGSTVPVSVTVTALAFVAGQPLETSQTIRAVAAIGDPTMTELVVSQ